jgi:spore germination protein KA
LGLTDLLRKILRKRKSAREQGQGEGTPCEPALPSALAQKMHLLKPYIEKNRDLMVRSFALGGVPDHQAAAIFMEGIIDGQVLSEDVLKPLMLKGLKQGGASELIDYISERALTVGGVQKLTTFSELVQGIFDGYTILIFDGVREALAVDIRDGERRGIEEPASERSTRGPREGFVESIVVNIALIRRRLRDPNLVAEKMVIGKRTRTELALLYIEDIAAPEVIDQLRERLSRIEIDGLLTCAQLDQLIEEYPSSIFPQHWTTERPDRVVSELLEGRIAIIVDGCPTALVAPTLFVAFLQAPEDYHDRTLVGSFNRSFRYLAFFLAISLPAIYIALLSFQPELLPFELMLSLAETRREVPFPVVVEMLLQEVIIQFIFESGVRLPSPLGQTVGVVGGIVLGQAAVSAKLASPAVIIVIAVTTISTFAMPTYSMALATRVLRIPLIILAAAFGSFGLSLGWLLILTHLIELESLGVPYFAPLAPMRFSDLKDTFFRTFFWKMNKRPVSYPVQDRRRQKNAGRRGSDDAG